jgi:hypothetical protein
MVNRFPVSLVLSSDLVSREEWITIAPNRNRFWCYKKIERRVHCIKRYGKWFTRRTKLLSNLKPVQTFDHRWTVCVFYHLRSFERADVRCSHHYLGIVLGGSITCGSEVSRRTCRTVHLSLPFESRALKLNGIKVKAFGLERSGAICFPTRSFDTEEVLVTMSSLLPAVWQLTVRRR